MSIILDEDESFNMQTQRDALGRFVEGHICLDKTLIAIECSYCGRKFERYPTRVWQSNYCSWKCYRDHKASKANKEHCVGCGKEFPTSKARLKSGRGKYCSRGCYAASMKGRTDYKKNKSIMDIYGIERANQIKSQLAAKSRELWQDPAYIRKQMKARAARPNHQESFMAKCFPFLRYVGDGKLIIGGKCPDFKVKRQRKLVELYGVQWHNPSEVATRIAHFNNFGWDCIIIWDYELKQSFSTVTNRLSTFAGIAQ